MLASRWHLARVHETVLGSTDQRASRLACCIHFNILSSVARLDSGSQFIILWKWQRFPWKRVTRLSPLWASQKHLESLSSSFNYLSSLVGRAIGMPLHQGEYNMCCTILPDMLSKVRRWRRKLCRISPLSRMRRLQTRQHPVLLLQHWRSFEAPGRMSV